MVKESNNKKFTLESAPRLSIGDLKEKGILLGNTTETKGELSLETGAMSYGKLNFSIFAVSDLKKLIRLACLVKTEQGTQNLNYEIQIMATPNHFGGLRWWFLCPQMKEGKQCLRRSKALYFTPLSLYLSCRDCGGLIYRSQKKHRDRWYETFEKPLDRLMVLEKRLMKVRSPEKKQCLKEEIGRLSSQLSQHIPSLREKPNVAINMK